MMEQTPQERGEETSRTPGCVWVVVPAFNETASIARTVRDVLATGLRVVVVDDGSRDHTAERARAAGAVVLRHAVNRGQGAALQTGISYALERGAELVVTFDADGQHDAGDIAELLRPVKEGRAEVALGSRFLGTAENMPLTRRLLLKGAVVFSRVTSGLPVTDTHNGLRAFTREAAGRVRITMDRMAHASELLDQVRRHRLRWVEVPVRVRYTPYSRNKGQRSIFAVRTLIEYMLGRLLG